MKKSHRFSIIFLAVFLTMALAIPAQADNYAKTIEIYKKSPVVQPFFNNCYGYAVFPTIGKAGFGIGGSYGTGQVYQGGKVTGETSLIKASIGFQAGGQAFSEMIFFEDKRAYDEFTGGNFEFDATASAVAITAGVEAKGGTEGATASASAGPATGAQAKTKYHKGMVVFTQAKGGLMYEAAIGGQKFNFKPKQ